MFLYPLAFDSHQFHRSFKTASRSWAPLCPVLGLLIGLLGCGGAPDDGGNGARTEEQTHDESRNADGSSDQGDEACFPGESIQEPLTPSAKGPWSVGARTLSAGALTVEAFYPAENESGTTSPPKEYDIRLALPESQQELISNQDAPLQICDCVDQAELSVQSGRFPLVVFIHGTAGWRTQSLTLMTQLASWGFVVLAADHPGLWLADILASTPFCFDSPTGQQNLRGDVDTILDALSEAEGHWAFLADAIDEERITLIGHSAGGSAVAQMTDLPGVRAIVSMAAGEEVNQPDHDVTSLFLGAHLDSVVPYSNTQSAFEASEGEKYLLGISGTGHLAFSDICELENTSGEDLVTIASEAGVCGTSFAGFLFDCDEDYLNAEKTNQIVSHTVVSVLLGAMQCMDTQEQLSQVQVRYPEVYEFQDN